MLAVLLVQWRHDGCGDMMGGSTMPASQQAGAVNGIWGLVCLWQVCAVAFSGGWGSH